ncbi:MAG: hypothetical protein ACHQRO_05615 [Vicinamibacteria bacterium]
MNRIADRGAITAAYVGIGMAVTIAISFVLVIPIEAVVWLLALPSGVMIGYYANARSNRSAGPWHRILTNAVFAAAVTGLTTALLLLGTKALFFYADTGYPDFNRADKAGKPIPPYCETGASCVYARYVAAGREAEMAAAGVTDPTTFGALYWREQVGTSLIVFGLTTVGGLIGGGLYGTFRPKPQAVTPTSPAAGAA